jgi:hypothetical protein
MELLEDGRGDHVYVPPGKSTELLNVVLEPIQMVSLTTETTGFGLTIMSADTLGATHPLELVKTTE